VNGGRPRPDDVRAAIDLSGARVKLDRAHEQVLALGETLAAFAENEPYQLAEQVVPGATDDLVDYRYVVTDLRPTRPEFAAHIGEILHNFRSALDYFVYAAATRHSFSTQFPIFHRATDWPAKSGPMMRAVPRRYARIVELAQPYQLPNPYEHTLSKLNYLSNTDKHRLLNTTATALSEAAPTFLPENDVAVIHDVVMNTGTLKEGGELVRLVLEPSGPEPIVTMAGEFRLAITFRDAAPAARNVDGESVMVVLVEIGRYLEELYDRFLTA
jgi:hypothetical protein